MRPAKQEDLVSLIRTPYGTFLHQAIQKAGIRIRKTRTECGFQGEVVALWVPRWTVNLLRQLPPTITIHRASKILARCNRDVMFLDACIAAAAAGAMELQQFLSQQGYLPIHVVPS